MLRNVERLQTEKFGPEGFIKVVKNVAEVVELMGSEEASVTLNYETEDCEIGDLVPTIQIGVARIRKAQSRPLNLGNVDG